MPKREKGKKWKPHFLMKNFGKRIEKWKNDFFIGTVTRWSSTFLSEQLDLDPPPFYRNSYKLILHLFIGTVTRWSSTFLIFNFPLLFFFIYLLFYSTTFNSFFSILLIEFFSIILHLQFLFYLHIQWNIKHFIHLYFWFHFFTFSE